MLAARRTIAVYDEAFTGCYAVRIDLLQLRSHRLLRCRTDGRRSCTGVRVLEGIDEPLTDSAYECVGVKGSWAHIQLGAVQGHALHTGALSVSYEWMSSLDQVLGTSSMELDPEPSLRFVR